jgi:branched-chain amino acid transport system substrate-binding protein
MTRLQSIMKLASCLLASVALPVAAGADTVRVGILNHDTGPFAVQGADFTRGIGVYLATHGNQCGPHTMEVITRDIGGANPAVARRLAEELVVRDQVSIMGGFYLSSDALSVADVVNEADIPGVLFVAASPSILQQSPNFIRAGQHVGQSAMIAAEYALQEGRRSAYIAVADYAPGHDVQRVFRTTFEAGGGNIVGEVRIPLNTVDFAPFAERISSAQPDVVNVFVPPGAPAVGLTRALASAGLMERAMVIGMGEAEDGDLRLFDDSLINFHQSLYYGEALDNPENDLFKARIRELFGDDVYASFASVSAYDGMALICAMIAAQPGGGFSTEVALSAGTAFNWNSPRGPMSIDPETREVIQNIYIRRVVSEDGRLANAVVDAFEAVRAPAMAD